MLNSLRGRLRQQQVLLPLRRRGPVVHGIFRAGCCPRLPIALQVVRVVIFHPGFLLRQHRSAHQVVITVIRIALSEFFPVHKQVRIQRAPVVPRVLDPYPHLLIRRRRRHRPLRVLPSRPLRLDFQVLQVRQVPVRLRKVHQHGRLIMAVPACHAFGDIKPAPDDKHIVLCPGDVNRLVMGYRRPVAPALNAHGIPGQPFRQVQTGTDHPVLRFRRDPGILVPLLREGLCPHRRGPGKLRILQQVHMGRDRPPLQLRYGKVGRAGRGAADQLRIDSGGRGELHADI